MFIGILAVGDLIYVAHALYGQWAEGEATAFNSRHRDLELRVCHSGTCVSLLTKNQREREIYKLPAKLCSLCKGSRSSCSILLVFSTCHILGEINGLLAGFIFSGKRRNKIMMRKKLEREAFLTPASHTAVWPARCRT